MRTGWYLAEGILGKIPYPINKNRSDKLLKTVKEEIEKREIDLLHFNHLDTACYAFDLDREIPAVFDSHNFLTNVLERYAELEPNFIKKRYIERQAKKMRAYEALVCRRVSLTLACSQDDAGAFERLAPGSRVEIIPNGVDPDRFREGRDRSGKRSDKILFLGSMDYLPNAEAVAFFIREVMPGLVERRSGLQFQVIGKNPPENIRKLAGANIKILEKVADIGPYLAQADLMIVPIFIGGGTRIKILEAMAAGLPVVSTTIGIEGIAGEDGRNFLLADNAEAMTDKILLLLENDNLRKEISENGKRFVKRYYTWEMIGEKLRKLYSDF